MYKLELEKVGSATLTDDGKVIATFGSDDSSLYIVVSEGRALIHTDKDSPPVVSIPVTGPAMRTDLQRRYEPGWRVTSTAAKDNRRIGYPQLATERAGKALNEVTLVCPKHRTYKGKYRPRTNCKICWDIYNQAHGIEPSQHSTAEKSHA